MLYINIAKSWISWNLKVYCNNNKMSVTFKSNTVNKILKNMNVNFNIVQPEDFKF